MARDMDSIRARLAELEAERDALNEQLQRLQAQRAQAMVCGGVSSITANSTAAEKITLFRRLFAGRSEVFPARWENRKTGKSGYAPACSNEWVRGVCGKPQVKCGECPNQAFIGLSDNVIANHLRGADSGKSSVAEFVAGVYPVRVDETCWFLAVAGRLASTDVHQQPRHLRVNLRVTFLGLSKIALNSAS